MKPIMTLEDIVRCADSVNAFFPGKTFCGAVGFFELHVDADNNIIFSFFDGYYKYDKETDVVTKLKKPCKANTDNFHAAIRFSSMLKQYEKIHDLMVAEKIPNEIMSMELNQDNCEITICTTTKIISCDRETKTWHVK